MPQDMHWSSVFRMPTDEEIHRHNQGNTMRSPYVFGWFSIPQDAKYTEYSVDIKADHLPVGTYCCPGNWYMDYSMVDTTYGKRIVDPNRIDGYAGFQSLGNGQRVGIMSFWDVFYQNAAGQTCRLRAKRAYPRQSDGNDAFGGEGTGAHCLVPYPWVAKHWYRMHLRCITSKHSGNTMVEQWVCDLADGKYTLLCTYDVGVKNSSFRGPVGVFLENFDVAHAGEVRSLEVCNVQYKDADTDRWVKAKEAAFAALADQPDYRGSYAFGTEGDRFWMITSGVGADKSRPPVALTVK